MPTNLSFAEHGAGIGAAASVVRANAVSAGLAAPVPPCPGWTVLDLVLHVGLAHRWATAVLDGLPQAQWPTDESVRAEGLRSGDVLDWFDDGMVRLLQVLTGSPEDLQAFFFLKDAPPPRDAWARRQCHETTIHGVDTMAARMRRLPQAAETWIRPELAADGVDELLRGFVPRRSGRVRTAPGQPPYAVRVQAIDIDRAWTMRVSADPVVTTTGSRTQEAQPSPQTQPSPETGGEPHGIPAVVLEGTAAQLYLGLWNRGEEFTAAGEGSAVAEFLALWRRDQRIEWS